MELKLSLNYNQVLRLIHQLSDKDKEKLASTILSDLSSKKKYIKRNIQEIILQAPTWNEEQMTDYQNARDHINKSRII